MSTTPRSLLLSVQEEKADAELHFTLPSSSMHVQNQFSCFSIGWYNQYTDAPWFIFWTIETLKDLETDLELLYPIPTSSMHVQNCCSCTFLGWHKQWWTSMISYLRTCCLRIQSDGTYYFYTHAIVIHKRALMFSI